MSNPFNLGTVTPYLIIDNVMGVVDFLKELVGAELRCDPKIREDGSVMHCEVVIGDSVVMMGEPTGEYHARPSNLYTYVEDSDAAHAKALELGATSVMEPMTFPHGDRYGGVQDVAGNTWWLVTHVGAEENST